MYSLIIKNAKVIDGSGKKTSEQLLDVAVEKEEIVNIAKNIPGGAHSIIDAKGQVLAPGFIDIQNHSDSYWQLFDNPGLNSLVSQGFTTIAVGQCGASLAPLLSSQSLLAIQKWHSLEGVNFNWQTFSEFLQVLSQKKFGCNIVSLVGYGTLRRGIVGDEVRALEKPELESLKKILKDSLAAGAFGLSSGLSYAHEIIISQIELLELAKIVAENKALFSVHLRGEGAEIIESLEEVLEIARSTDLNLKISHLKTRGASNWKNHAHMVSLLETAYHKGLKVHFDVYPYDTTWQPLYSYLPKWAIEGGRSLMLKHFSDSVQKNKILAYLNSTETKWADIIIASSGNRLQFLGKTIGQVAKNLEISSEAAVLHILENAGSEILVFEKNLSEPDVLELLMHPLGFVGTDGGGFGINQKNKLVHPRCFGSAPKFLKLAKATEKLTLEEAVNKLTLGPALKLGIPDRGCIKVGYKADLVIFDENNISDKATYENPYQYSEGINYVFVNGIAEVVEGKLTSEMGGKALKKK
jgi:N-acyl-D-amino-acid deacylase